VKETKKKPHKAHLNSRAALKTAQKDITDGILERSNEIYGAEADGQLSSELAERCMLTNAATTEFLRQFWSAFLSGDADRAMELQYLVEALGRSAERIEAVAADAEKERQGLITQKKKEVRAYFEKTGKKARWSADMVKGGRPAVENLLSSTIAAIKKAQEDYKRAWDAEMAQQQQKQQQKQQQQQQQQNANVNADADVDVDALGQAA
jgi:transcription initiation factor TFIIH subunit 1